MNAQDLRIGNLVEYKITDSLDERKEWRELNPIGVFDLQHLVEFPEDGFFKPIPLNEEWLLKFGFKENYSSYKIENNKYLLELHYYDCWNLTYIEKPKYGKSSAELSGYWNLHELQNLFFALTGEELTYENN